MPRIAFGDFLRFIHVTCAGRGPSSRTDRELLERFLIHQEESAFTLLVQRHGPMVFAVCRRLLGDSHEAEDAFQATFLVFVRRARSIQRKESVGGWLHGVAQRIGLKARAQVRTRRQKEREAANMRSARPVDNLSCQELRSALDEELGSLPEKYRTTIVLCHLEGKSYDQAARELGCTKISLSRRLTRARELLRRKLERRGITLAVGALTTTLTEMAAAAPLAALLTIKTMKAAMLVAAGKTAAGGCLSAGAMALAEEALIGMVGIKGKLLFMVVTIGLAVGGAGWAGYGGLGEKSQPAQAPRAQAPFPKGDKITGKKDVPAVDLYGDQLPNGAVGRLGTVRFNHGDSLNSLFYLPDGKTLVSEGSGRIRLWDAGTGKEVRQFSTGEGTSFDQAALSPDGRFLTLLSQQSPSDTVRIWDLVQGKEVRVVPLPVQRRGMDVWHHNALSPDGSLGVVNMPKQIQIFDIETARELWRLPNDEGDKGLAMTFARNDQLVTADKNHLVQVWESRTGKLVREFKHASPAHVLAASADGSRLATLEQHHTYAIDRLLERDQVHIWDLTTGTKLRALAAPPKSGYMNVRFSPDGNTIFASGYRAKSGSAATTWDVATGKQTGGLESGYALAVSPDGRCVALGAAKFNLVDLKTGRPAAFAESRQAWANEVFLSSAGDRAFTIGHFSISDWDVASGRSLHAVDVPYVASSLPHPTHSPDGRFASSFEGDYKDVSIIIWDVIARKRLHTLRPPGANADIKTAFSADSSLFAVSQSGKDAIIKVWDVGAGKEVSSFKDTKNDWSGVPYFTTNTLTVAGRDVVGFDIATGKELYSWRMKPINERFVAKMVVEKGGKEIKQPDPSAWRTIAISPDGTTAAGIMPGGYSKNQRAEKRIYLCDAKNGRVLGRMNDSGINTSGWEQVSFSHDSRLLATSDGAIVHLWEVATRKEVRAFSGHRGDIQSLSFSANGRRLASSSNDTTCLIWDIPLAVGVAEPLVKMPGEKEMAAWWSDLAGADPRQAYAAVWRLADAGKDSVPYIGQRLGPVTEAQVKQINQYVADLGNETFAVRQKAFQALNTLGPPTEPALRRAMENNPPLEVRIRLDQLLSNLSNGPSAGEPLRMVRALAVLEHARTPEARRLLQNLADGAAGAWLTSEAKRVCERLAVGQAF